MTDRSGYPIYNKKDMIVGYILCNAIPPMKPFEPTRLALWPTLDSPLDIGNGKIEDLTMKTIVLEKRVSNGRMRYYWIDGELKTLHKFMECYGWFKK